MQQGKNDKVTEYVGKRIQARRIQLSLSVDEFASSLGITRQEVLGYESGFERIGSNLFFRISNILKVEAAHLFEGIAEQDTSIMAGLIQRDDDDTHSFMETCKRIKHKHLGKNLLKLIESIIQDETERTIKLT